MPRKRGKYFVDNKELYRQIKISKEQDELTKEALDMLMLIAQRAITRLTFVRPDDKEDCLASAYMDLIKYWRNFNLDYTNPFAYYTEIAKRGYAKAWNKLYPKKYKGTISLDSGFDDDGGIYSI